MCVRACLAQQHRGQPTTTPDVVAASDNKGDSQTIGLAFKQSGESSLSKCLSNFGTTGFEPATYWSQTSRATKLRHVPPETHYNTDTFVGGSSKAETRNKRSS